MLDLSKAVPFGAEMVVFVGTLSSGVYMNGQ